MHVRMRVRVWAGSLEANIKTPISLAELGALFLRLGERLLASVSPEICSSLGLCLQIFGK